MANYELSMGWRGRGSVPRQAMSSTEGQGALSTQPTPQSSSCPPLQAWVGGTLLSLSGEAGHYTVPGLPDSLPTPLYVVPLLHSSQLPQSKSRLFPDLEPDSYPILQMQRLKEGKVK